MTVVKTLVVGEEIPQVLTKRQLAAYLQISERQLDDYRRLRNHPAVKEIPGPGHPRFDGRAVKAWRDGGEAKPTRRFFRKAG